MRSEEGFLAAARLGDLVRDTLSQQNGVEKVLFPGRTPVFLRGTAADCVCLTDR